MKKLIIGFLLVAGSQLASAQNSSIYNKRSDTIDVLNYTVRLNVTDFTTNVIKGSTDVLFSPKMNNRPSISLDLLKMTIDSIKLNGLTVSYSYNDTLLVSYFPSVLNDNDTATLSVYYHGVPQGDPSGWGGWYFQSGYGYNLGVGFESLPHNFGRVWHPCVDNFTERASYTFEITTTGGKVGYCNGYLVKDTVVGVNTTRTWRLNEPIPSYLACVAVNNYTHVNQQYISTVTGDTTPVMLISLPADTTAFKNSFIHLTDALHIFEEAYGPYLWNKMGYVAVPFNAGAMEHASIISYPKFSINGNTAYETLMAHELSHHWWGDLVTCETAEEMWINEGMARYSEALFLEKKYNYTQYINEIKNIHKNVVWKSHVTDGGSFPLNGVPQNVTYGEHSYQKGADVVHSMRTYMGDSLFFAGLKSITSTHHYVNINSTQFRDQLNTVPGVNVTDFFNDWVFQKGFTAFQIDSFVCTGTAPNVTVTLYIKQKLRFAPSYYTNVPMQVNFRNGWTEYTANITVGNQYCTATVTNIPFVPQFVYLNGNDKISQAVTGENTVIKTTGLKSLSYANFTYQVTTVSDSCWVRAEQYWVPADSFQTNQFMYVISPDRSWRVYMNEPQNFVGVGRINYNGTTGASGHLDNGLMTNWGSVNFREDSLRLFYREDSRSDWTECVGYHFIYANMTDKQGTLFIDSLKNGEYAMAFKLSSVSVPEKNHTGKFFKVYPNPTDSQVTVETLGITDDRKRVIVTDESGRELINQAMDKTNHMQLKINARGLVFVTLYVNNEPVATQKVVVK